MLFLIYFFVIFFVISAKTPVAVLFSYRDKDCTLDDETFGRDFYLAQPSVCVPFGVCDSQFHYESSKNQVSYGSLFIFCLKVLDDCVKHEDCKNCSGSCETYNIGECFYENIDLYQKWEILNEFPSGIKYHYGYLYFTEDQCHNHEVDMIHRGWIYDDHCSSCVGIPVRSVCDNNTLYNYWYDPEDVDCQGSYSKEKVDPKITDCAYYFGGYGEIRCENFLK